MSKRTALFLRWFSRERRRGEGVTSTEVAVGSQPHDAGEPERLERIATYARAGYFNMGYTFEMFPLVGDLPPD